jgi:hypothetical protein
VQVGGAHELRVPHHAVLVRGTPRQRRRGILPGGQAGVVRGQDAADLLALDEEQVAIGLEVVQRCRPDRHGDAAARSGDREDVAVDAVVVVVGMAERLQRPAGGVDRDRVVGEVVVAVAGRHVHDHSTRAARRPAGEDVVVDLVLGVVVVDEVETADRPLQIELVAVDLAVAEQAQVEPVLERPQVELVIVDQPVDRRAAAGEVDHSIAGPVVEHVACQAVLEETVAHRDVDDVLLVGGGTSGAKDRASLGGFLEHQTVEDDVADARLDRDDVTGSTV